MASNAKRGLALCLSMVVGVAMAAAAPPRPCEPEFPLRMQLVETNVPRLQHLDVARAPGADSTEGTVPLLRACPFLAPWPDHRLVSALVRRTPTGSPRVTLALQDLTGFYDVVRAGPALVSLFAWQRQPKRVEAARLVRWVIDALGCRYVRRRDILPLERALATGMPTGERFPLQLELRPMHVGTRFGDDWVIRTDALVYDRARAGIFRYRCEFQEGSGTIDVTRVVSAGPCEVPVFRSILDDFLDSRAQG